MAGIYYPEGYGDAEVDHTVNRKALREILTGKWPLPM